MTAHYNRLVIHTQWDGIIQILNCWNWNASWLSEHFSGYLLCEKGRITYWLMEILTKGEKKDILQVLGFSQWCWWRSKSYGMLYHVTANTFWHFRGVYCFHL